MNEDNNNDGFDVPKWAYAAALAAGFTIVGGCAVHRTDVDMKGGQPTPATIKELRKSQTGFPHTSDLYSQLSKGTPEEIDAAMQARVQEDTRLNQAIAFDQLFRDALPNTGWRHVDLAKQDSTQPGGIAVEQAVMPYGTSVLESRVAREKALIGLLQPDFNSIALGRYNRGFPIHYALNISAEENSAVAMSGKMVFGDKKITTSYHIKLNTEQPSLDFKIHNHDQILNILMGTIHGAESGALGGGVFGFIVHGWPGAAVGSTIGAAAGGTGGFVGSSIDAAVTSGQRPKKLGKGNYQGPAHTYLIGGKPVELLSQTGMDGLTETMANSIMMQLIQMKAFDDPNGNYFVFNYGTEKGERAGTVVFKIDAGQKLVKYSYNPQTRQLDLEFEKPVDGYWERQGWGFLSSGLAGLAGGWTGVLHPQPGSHEHEHGHGEPEDSWGGGTTGGGSGGTTGGGSGKNNYGPQGSLDSLPYAPRVPLNVNIADMFARYQAKLDLQDAIAKSIKPGETLIGQQDNGSLLMYNRTTNSLRVVDPMSLLGAGPKPTEDRVSTNGTMEYHHRMAGGIPEGKDYNPRLARRAINPTKIV